MEALELIHIEYPDYLALTAFKPQKSEKGGFLLYTMWQTLYNYSKSE